MHGVLMDQRRANHIQRKRVPRSGQCAHKPRFPAGGAVTLHPHDAIHHTERGLQGATQVCYHLPERLTLRETAVQLRFHQTGDAAEQILDRRAQPHHSMCF